MSRPAALVGIPLLLTAWTLSACGENGTPTVDTAGPSGDPQTAFTVRAEQVAHEWRESSAVDAWRTGFVPLEPLTGLTSEGGFTEATKLAFGAGWYRLAVGMPRERGGRTGTIRYAAGGTQDVPLVTMAQAYGELDQGDPPPCPGPSIPPPADAPRPGGAPKVQDNLEPDLTVSGGPGKPCVALTVTRVSLGTTTIRTSRGEAEVPAWLFTVRELTATVARVAVAPAAIAGVPELRMEDLERVPGLVGASDLTDMTGTRLAYRLGVGSCDEDIKPLAYETDEVVVVAGTATTRPGVCTDELRPHPVSVELDRPVGDRPVINAATGEVLTLRPVD